MSTKHKRRIKYLAFTLAPVLLIALIALAVTSSTNQMAIAQEPAPCAACHNDTTLVLGKATQWEESLHGTGEAYLRGTSASCAGCHSGGGFSAMVAAGQEPNQVTSGDPNPTRQDCRACHQIHTSYTGADFALETTAAVDFYVTGIAGIYDGGKGNLCVKCHQPRTKAPALPAGGTMSITSTHWGPHHGPQSTMLLGTNGAGAAASGTPSGHYSLVGDTCVGCHMGANDNHGFKPNDAVCETCHPGTSGFNINGVQTTVQGKLDTLKGLLVNAGLLACAVDEEGVEECHPVVGTYPDNQAYALWNWIYIANEDGSKGVHNAAYTNALLDDSIAAIPCNGAPVLGLGQPAPFWASYADYQARLLSVTYPVNNNGSTNAHNVILTNSIATNGVTVASSLPASVGNIAAGASVPLTVKYNVPPGVGSFRTTNGATAEDNCGTTYTYGTQPPSP